MDSILSEARRVQESVMVDRVRVERIEKVFDRATGRDVETATLVWEGPARLPRADGQVRANLPGVTATPTDPVVIVPWGTPRIAADDRVTVTRSVSPHMEGRVLWVTDSSPRTFQSAVHLTCREVRDAVRSR